MTLVQAADFWARVTRSEGCWEWDRVNKSGYGTFQGVPAHRVAWALENGPVPRGMMILHSCDNRRCVRPSHLRPGTAKENAQDAVTRGRKRTHYDPLLSLRSAALELGVTPDTLRQQIRKGKLAATMLGGWHVRKSEVERYRLEHRRAAEKMQEALG